MNKDIVFAIAIIFALLIGVIVGKLSCKRKPDGTIVVENSPDRERTVIRFVMDIELEEIQNRKEIRLNVDNRLS